MTDRRIGLRLLMRLALQAGHAVRFLSFFVLALIGTTVTAAACTDGDAMQYYFFDHEPTARAGRDMLLVHILSVDGDAVRATLDERLAKALGVDAVTIDLPEYPLGGNCIDYGIMSGTAIVVVDGLVRWKSGEMHIVAAPVKGPYDTRPRRSNAELESYIVDPGLKAALAKARLK
ncbi:hypothetical protein MZO42_14425 [Sphingomonas psychrotolerans]|uniref:Uncharacterized protein n=1 Tax=Sphingomonas psychrotolerans TaxID=1327635 RepID=A0ABU3N5U1_9SPHN|nr:hypothetical protein [Sphingomonas psychrotolerans]MDT8759895.1 hypothetical protein [Sphingomonas psychrotolerans]